MSSIHPLNCLNGKISELCTLKGTITSKGTLTGRLSVKLEYNAYSGEYEVIPSASDERTLDTTNKILKKNIIVQKIPYFETTNLEDGITVYIAEEV